MGDDRDFAEPWRLGALYDTTGDRMRFFANGAFADVRMYKRPLSPEEVQILYELESARRKN